jgi:hypothetical protein
MHPDHYLRLPRCGCGGERRAIEAAGGIRPMTWRVDKYRNTGREQKGRTCICGEYSFPHYRGRGWCLYSEAKRDQREHREAWA